MTSSQNPSPEPTLRRPASEAILFIPGIAGPPLEQTAFRIASAFNVCSQSAVAEFLVSSGQDEEYVTKGTQLKTKFMTIQRAEPGKDLQNLVDVYEYNYVDALIKKHIESNLLVKAWRLFVQLFVNIPRMCAAFGRNRHQKSPLERAQLVFASAVLSLLVVYLVVLAVAVYDIAGQVISSRSTQSHPTGVSSPLSTPTSPQAAGAYGFQRQPWDSRLIYFPILIVVVAIVEVFYPGLKKGLADASVRYASAVGYLSFGSREGVLEGQFNALVDHMKAKGYQRIHVVAYSFGSVLALDSIFPADRAPLERIKEIDSLVTVGCPFDLIRVFWPEYYESRYESLKESRKGNGSLTQNWVNIYAPIDLLGSNFRNDQQISLPEPEQAIELKDTANKLCPSVSLAWTQGRSKNRLSLIEFFALAGLEAHNSYWEHSYESENTAFSLIIPAIYPDHPFLS